MHRDLARIAQALTSTSSPDDVARACADAYLLFSDGASLESVTATGVSRAGVALAPVLAANCLLDFERTRAFVRGAVDAIAVAHERFPDDTIDVLYAGCGPLAPLALLAIPHLDPTRVRFTLLDVHPESVAAAATLVERLDVSRYVHVAVCADATTYRHNGPLHVVISETMQRSLNAEPYVAIVRNLRTQMHDGALLVPERVTVHLASLDAGVEQARWSGDGAAHDSVIRHGVAMEVDRAGERGTSRIRITGQSGRWLAFLTSITVHGSTVLAPYSSGLTTPEILWNASPLGDDVTIDLAYRDGDHPHLQWSVAAT